MIQLQTIYLFTARDCDRLNHHNLKIIFSLFMAIAWGACVRTILRVFHLSIPYTVVLMISGLLIGLGSQINLTFCETWSTFTKIARTPPEIILYVFLPVLIFESAFSMKAHVFFRSWGQVSKDLVQFFILYINLRLKCQILRHYYMFFRSQYWLYQGWL